MIDHTLTFHKGGDLTSNVMRCSCGWACSGMRHAIKERSGLHCMIFANEPRSWSDPLRETMMPMPLLPHLAKA